MLLVFATRCEGIGYGAVSPGIHTGPCPTVWRGINEKTVPFCSKLREHHSCKLVFANDCSLATSDGRKRRARYGAPVEMMQLKHGIFDDASVSVITSDTVRKVCRLAGRGADVRRFRPNIVVRSLRAVPFRKMSGLVVRSPRHELLCGRTPWKRRASWLMPRCEHESFSNGTR